ncbi:MAG: hypothetical protein KBS55_06240 [Bacteroidales bacterium]|nr:hypothetical protein [Candidatus Cryptobacteroides aphodequi]
MNTIRLLLLLTSVAIFCNGRNARTIIVTTTGDRYDVHNMVSLSPKGDTLSARTYGSSCKAIPNGAVLDSWDSKKHRCGLHIYRKDSLIYERFFYEFHNSIQFCEPNNPDYVVVSLINQEVECFTDTMSFLCYNLKTGEEHWCAVKGDRLYGPEKCLNVKFAYFEWYPRGAGNKIWSIVLRIIDLQKKTVTDLLMGRNVTDWDSRELPDFQLQWKDATHLLYSTRHYPSEPSILRVYSYDCSRKTFKKEKQFSVSTTEDTEDAIWLWHDGDWYLRTDGWLYLCKKNNRRKLFQLEEIESMLVE